MKLQIALSPAVSNCTVPKPFL